jgi:RNA polymerase sigma-70 factor (family 1)
MHSTPFANRLFLHLSFNVAVFEHKTPDEPELLSALAVGSEAAFTAIYNRHHQAMYNYILRFVKVPQLTEDLVHEIFIKIWETRATLHITKDFSAYLFRICHNKAMDELKKIAADRSLRQLVIYWMTPAHFTDNTVLSKMQDYEQLARKAIDSLPPRRREVFLLCTEGGKTYDQAAKALGISRNTVKEHMVHASRALRKYLIETGQMMVIIAFVKNIF